ncbi:unnamed protein product [Moneuplotes crassus]|uniref:Uncharacterized protein n=1 Tax=Euplotes crassus TaxID=5936 RepID=A0AAD1U6Q3_EUPCR|nr:unnamed protein product [Moneuplotes crassus]
MNFPQCSAISCDRASEFYLNRRRIYCCSNHRDTQYSGDEGRRLVDPESIKTIVCAVSQCMKEFLISDGGQEDLDQEEGYAEFNDLIKEMSDKILFELETAIEQNEYYEFIRLYDKAMELKSFIMGNELFLKYSTNLLWEKALSVIRYESEKSPDLSNKELTEKYEKYLTLVTKQFKQRRCEIERAKNEEISRLNNIITELRRKLDDEQVSNQQTKAEYFEKEQKQSSTIEINTIKLKLTQKKNENKEHRQKIDELEDSLTERVTELNKTQNDLVQMKEKYLPPAGTYSEDEFNLLFDPNEGNKLKKIKVLKSSKKKVLELELNDDKDFKQIESIKKRIPDIYRFSISSIPIVKYIRVNTLLNKYFPESVEVLHFNNNSELNPYLEIYISKLCKIGPRVSQEFLLYNFEFSPSEASQNNLITIFESYKHVKILGFPGCKLGLSRAPDFGDSLNGIAVECLDLNWCGSKQIGDFNNIHVTGYILTIMCRSLSWRLGEGKPCSCLSCRRASQSGRFCEEFSED